MSTSILTSVKKALGIDDAYEAFDPELIMHINTVLSTLNQIGIGPDNGYAIEDAEATWDDLLDGDPRFNNVKSYVYLKVRLIFDPPATSFALAAMQDQTRELEVRINIAREVERWP